MVPVLAYTGLFRPSHYSNLRTLRHGADKSFIPPKRHVELPLCSRTRTEEGELNEYTCQIWGWKLLERAGRPGGVPVFPRLRCVMHSGQGRASSRACLITLCSFHLYHLFTLSFTFNLFTIWTIRAVKTPVLAHLHQAVPTTFPPPS